MFLFDICLGLHVQDMVVHKIHIQSRGLRLEEWRIDSDEYSYIQLYQDVCSEFQGQSAFMERSVEIKMKAYIKGGKHILKVDSDISLMKMFELNIILKDHIDLYIDVQVVMFVPPQGDRSESYDETIEFLDDEKSQLIRIDGIEKQGMGVDEVEVPSVDKQGEEGLIDVEVEGEADSDEELQPDDGSEVQVCMFQMHIVRT